MRTINLFILLFVFIQSFAQTEFTSHIISDDTEGAVSLHACDIDNDSDIDILGAVYEENLIVCWYNAGNNVDFERITIETNFAEAGSVHSGDYNNDGLIDVCGGARLGNKVCVWYNTGDRDNWTKQTLHNNYLYAHEFYSVDIDGDDDIDILGASSSLNEITLWENNGGNPVNWEEITIDSDFGMAKSVTAGDIDKDGDLDIVGAALSDNEIAWWENDNETWAKHIITTSYSGVHRVQIVDMDNDGNLDVLAAAYLNNSIAWWKNDGNNQSEWEKEIVQIGFSDACIAFGCDFDNDNEIEVIGTSQQNDELAYFEKDPNNTIQWEKTLVDEVLAAWSLEVADMDGDGDMDIFAASGKGGGNHLVKWYENKTTNVGLKLNLDPALFSVTNTNSKIQVNINKPFNTASLSIFNILGEKLYYINNLQSKNVIPVKQKHQSNILLINLVIDGKSITKKSIL
jgi:FG-GAP-like repeat